VYLEEHVTEPAEAEEHRIKAKKARRYPHDRPATITAISLPAVFFNAASGSATPPERRHHSKPLVHFSAALDTVAPVPWGPVLDCAPGSVRPLATKKGATLEDRHRNTSESRCRSALTPPAWSVYGAKRAQPVATAGKCARPENGSNKRIRNPRQPTATMVRRGSSVRVR
jgi:hypothetical protein